MEEYSVIGKRLPRIDGPIKTTGEAKYTADISLPGMLHGKILRSPFAHARIHHLETSKAERLMGVRAVVVGKDFGNFKYGFLPTTRDESPLALDKVRFIGEEVAAVAAIDEDIAQEALDLIRVEYEELPAVFDPLAAMQEGAPQLHDHVKNNISAQAGMNFGDVEAGFRASDYIREDRFVTQPVLHGFLEPHAAIAQYDASGKVTIWASKQSPYFLYRNLATALKLPLNKVRVIQPHIGGGFGGKNESFALDFAAALLSKKTGKPVKIVYSQEEVLTAGRRRHPMILELKTGCKRDGTLVASYCRNIADGGAYTSVGPLTIYLCGVFLTLPYRLPHVKYEAYRVFTNKPVSVAQRGNGIPQIRFAAEVQLDMIAEDLGIDPVEIRLRNAVQPGDLTANNLRITSCGLRESIQKVAQKVGWQERRKRTRGWEKKLRGIGIACNSLVSGARLRGHNSSGAVIRVHEDGGISLLTGSTDSGQGSETVLAQIAAEELGVAFDDIQVSHVDTELTPIDPGSYGSRVTSIAGNAVRAAAIEVKRQLAELAAEKLEANPEDIEFREKRVYVRGSPERGMAFKQLATIACYSGSGRTILGRGSYAHDIEVPNWETGEGNLSAAYSFGAQAAEVEVDIETGRVRILNSVVAHDCGRAINPMAAEGQFEGSISGGLGQALLEEFLIKEGQTLNPSFLEYRLPSAKDTPPVETILIETIDPVGPFGAKEAGEGTQISTVPAIVNAISNALGVWIKELPITPERVLQALEEKGRESK